MHSRSAQFVWGFLLASCTALSGCSRGDRPPLGYVSGRVLIDGDPLVGAIVIFQPTVGRAAQAQTDANGRYELTYLDGAKGAKVGTNRVALTWPLDYDGGQAIPARYSGDKSELVREVQKGRNAFDFELESAP